MDDRLVGIRSDVDNDIFTVLILNAIVNVFHYILDVFVSFKIVVLFVS